VARRGIALALTLLGGLSLLLGSLGATAATAQSEDGAVFVVDVSGEIDRGIGPYLSRVIDDAEAAGASAVLLEIDTPGGLLDATLEIRNTLLSSPVPTLSYINRDALSAGALIALSTERIYVAPGASFGAATPVVGTGQPADEKVVSALRAMFRATAEDKGRDGQIAAAMVDDRIEVEGVVGAGELLTLTDSEALEVGFAEARADTRADALAEAGLDGREVIETAPSLAERLVRFLTSPLLGSLMFTLGVFMIIGELFAGGVGIGTAIGAGLLGVFFYGHLLAGLTGWEDVVLVVVGITLILVELFVIPGFGVAGLLGITSLLGGGFLAMTGRDWDFVSGAQIASTAGTLLVTFVVVGAAIITGLVLLSRRRDDGETPRVSRAMTPKGGTGQRRGWLRWFGDGDVLAGEDDEEVADPSHPPSPSLIAKQGAIGTALSDLRPAGVADFEGHRIDVVTEGDYIATGERVEVIRAERYRRVVKRAPGGQAADGPTESPAEPVPTGD